MSNFELIRFKPLDLSGRNKGRVMRSSMDHMCNMDGCWKYIDAGTVMIRWNTFDMHVGCAKDWCARNRVEEDYDEMVSRFDAKV